MSTQQLENHITAVNQREEIVRALVSWDETAARARAERACADGPLAGWALGVKDIIDVRGLPTRCGTDFLPKTPVETTAQIVERLESLGAYVFSKVVSTQFAFFDPGPTTNPWNAGHTPGGSSQGSAAAVAAGIVRLALGTQTIASINRPAAYCGVVGFKPTFERMSHEGLFPFSSSVDTIGFFTANMVDMETVCSAIFGRPEAAFSSSPRVGVVEDLYCEPADTEMLEALQTVATKIQSAGYDVQPAKLPEVLEDSYENHLKLVRGEAAGAHRKLFERYGEHYSPNMRRLLKQGQALRWGDIDRARHRRIELEEALNAFFEQFDVLMTPSAPGAAPNGLRATGDPRMSLIFTHTRVPCLTLPGALNKEGLPLGIQFAARKMNDAALVATCRELEPAIAFGGQPGNTQLTVRDPD